MLVDFADNVSKEVSIPVVLGGGWSDMDTIQELINTTDIEYLSMYRPFVKSQSFLTEWMENKHGRSECKTCNNCYWKKSSVCIIDSED